jgi:hypothetical protein
MTDSPPAVYSRDGLWRLTINSWFFKFLWTSIGIKALVERWAEVPALPIPIFEESFRGGWQWVHTQVPSLRLEVRGDFQDIFTNTHRNIRIMDNDTAGPSVEWTSAIQLNVSIRVGTGGPSIGGPIGPTADWKLVALRGHAECWLPSGEQLVTDEASSVQPF